MTGEETEDGEGGSLTLDEAVSILGEETRARILVELGERARKDGVGPMALSFSELMEEVGVEDSGRFNYHLDKLVGTFVRRVEDEAWLKSSDASHGYMALPSGWLVYRALVVGTLTDHDAVDPFDVGACPDCDGTLVAEYHRDRCLFVTCDDCESIHHFAHLSDRAFDGRTDGGVLDASIRKERHTLESLRQGVCFACGSAVERDLWIDLPEMWNVLRDHDAYATLICSGCGEGFVGHPAVVASTTVPVVSFFHERGRDARAEYPWTDPLADAQARTAVHDEDTVAVTVPFELGDERLAVRLDDDLEVRDIERTAVGDIGGADRDTPT